jgi:hypothetical protein
MEAEMEDKRPSEAWQKGYNEGVEGMDERNPYPIGSEEAMDFEDGYSIGVCDYYERGED